MNLRERIEDNLTVWLLGTLLTGFLTGLGAYKQILEIAQLEVIPKVKLEQLQAAASQVTHMTQANGLKVDAAEPTPKEASDSTGEASTSVSSAQVHELRLSASASPFPEHYDSVRLGMKLSEAQLILPGGRMNAEYYSVDLDSPLFTGVQFVALGHESDPKIESVYFRFRDEGAKRIVISSLLKEIGHLPHKSESLGQRLIWPNVHGFNLTIEDNYVIEPKEE
jgi:hypothetical protein